MNFSFSTTWSLIFVFIYTLVQAPWKRLHDTVDVATIRETTPSCFVVVEFSLKLKCHATIDQSRSTLLIQNFNEAVTLRNDDYHFGGTRGIMRNRRGEIREIF